MTVQLSFSKIEKELLPAFRQQIGSAESTEDVKKFFVHTILDLVSRACGDDVKPRYEDIHLNDTGKSDECKFSFSDSLTANPQFSSIWGESDLQHIVDRFAVAACHRYKHLKKNPEKTEAKIRM